MSELGDEASDSSQPPMPPLSRMNWGEFSPRTFEALQKLTKSKGKSQTNSSPPTSPSNGSKDNVDGKKATLMDSFLGRKIKMKENSSNELSSAKIHGANTNLKGSLDTNEGQKLEFESKERDKKGSLLMPKRRAPKEMINLDTISHSINSELKDSQFKGFESPRRLESPRGIESSRGLESPRGIESPRNSSRSDSFLQKKRGSKIFSTIEEKPSFFAKVLASRAIGASDAPDTNSSGGEDEKDVEEDVPSFPQFNAPVFVEDQVPFVELDWDYLREIEASPEVTKRRRNSRFIRSSSSDNLGTEKENASESQSYGNVRPVLDRNRSASPLLIAKDFSTSRDDLPKLSEILSHSSPNTIRKLSREEIMRMRKDADSESAPNSPRMRQRRKGIIGIDMSANLGSAHALAEVNRLATYLPSIVIWKCIKRYLQEVKLKYPALSSQIDEDFKNKKAINKMIHKWSSYFQPSDYSENGESEIHFAELEKLPNASLLIADVSGFTKLNETFASQGNGGVEKVTSHLNHFLSSLLEIICDHGGDCVKFAGDALIVLFFNEDWNSHETALRAVQCALELQSKAGIYVAENVELTLHVGVASGNLFAMYAGGVENEWEFLIAGSPFKQIQSTIDLSKSGEVVISRECFNLISHAIIFEDAKNASDGEKKVIQIKPTFEIDPQQSVQYYIPFGIKNLLKCFVPIPVLDKLETGQEKFLAEHRRASVIFVNLRGLVLNQTNISDVSVANKALRSMEVVLMRNQGFRRQFLVDDKGSTFIGVFGVPPYAHEDDAYRAVKTAMELRKELSLLDLDHSIGIATGQVYVGSVGKDSFRKSMQ